MDGGRLSPEIIKSATNAAVSNALRSMPRGAFCADWLTGLMLGHEAYMDDAYKVAVEKMLRPANALAKMFRTAGAGRGTASIARVTEFPSLGEIEKMGAIAKADLDVGTLTNFANINGGQTLGYVSLDTQMARGTVRPDSFTLYQALRKSAAFQVVDYWPFASDTGGGLPGTAFQSYGDVSTGVLDTNAGVYNLQNITLKLAVDGRSITTALAAQNSFVDVQAQENINAALNILTSTEWTCYFGDPTLYPNQFQGLTGSIPAANVFDYRTFHDTIGAANGWTPAQTLFNQIYVAVASIADYPVYGRPTHAFMSPDTMGTLQSQVTTLLNNITNKITDAMTGTPIVVNGDFRGMNTRFGDVAFPMDLFITARNKPAQAILDGEGNTMAKTIDPTAPLSAVAAAVSSSASGSAWTGDYVSGSPFYTYAVASTDAASNESLLTWSINVAGPPSGDYMHVTITPPSDNTAIVYRVYRSGRGYNPASSGVANPASVRYIGSILANGASTVVFNDYNTHLPGSNEIFLLDLDDRDDALDFRFLLPLTRIELFAQNLFMPWAVTMIGAIRNKVPKFHGRIRNFVPLTAGFDPLAPNNNAT